MQGKIIKYDPVKNTLNIQLYEKLILNVHVSYVRPNDKPTIYKCLTKPFNKSIAQLNIPMLWVLKTISMRQFLSAPKTNVRTDGSENIPNSTLQKSVYLDLRDNGTFNNFRHPFELYFSRTDTYCQASVCNNS